MAAGATITVEVSAEGLDRLRGLVERLEAAAEKVSASPEAAAEL